VTLGNGYYIAAVSPQGVTDAAGNVLDGDASGSAGGTYRTWFHRLAGDANGDGQTGVADWALLADHYGAVGHLPPGDLNGDGVVGIADLSILAENYSAFVPAILGDANRDGEVGLADLAAVADNYGRAEAQWRHGDFNGDGTVGIADLALLADNYGRTVLGSPGPETGAGSDTSLVPPDATDAQAARTDPEDWMTLLACPDLDPLPDAVI
jgi:hypothetical protein